MHPAWVLGAGSGMLQSSPNGHGPPCLGLRHTTGFSQAVSIKSSKPRHLVPPALLLSRVRRSSLMSKEILEKMAVCGAALRKELPTHNVQSIQGSPNLHSKDTSHKYGLYLKGFTAGAGSDPPLLWFSVSAPRGTAPLLN